MGAIWILGVAVTVASALWPDPRLARQAPSAAPPASAVAALRMDLDALVGRPPGSERWGVLVVSLDRGDTLHAFMHGVPLVPASNMKLLTTAAALRFLGGGHRFQTFLLTDGVVRHGTLYGNLYLFGTGDPTVGQRFQDRPAAPLEAFADTLVAMGIREVRGDVVADASYFAGRGSGRGWHHAYLDQWYAAPAGAISVHENMVRLEVRPGESPGARPAVEYIPGGRGIGVVNLATTGGGRLRARRFAFDAPIVIEGGIGGGVATHAVAVGDPARYAAALFRDVLVSRDIIVAGGIRVVDRAEDSPVSGRRIHAPAFDTVPMPRVLAAHASAPLREILHVVNHNSHNFYSEQVLRAAGRVAAGEGSARGGELAIRAVLVEAGADTAGLRVEDGSGLSPLNRVSPRTFVGLLSHMKVSPWAVEFRETLPVAGNAPRFRRMGGTAAEGNLQAKTGTIDHVSALSGYVTARNGERLAFSVISNGVTTTARSKYIENLIGARLAEFHRAEAPARAAAVDGVAPGGDVSAAGERAAAR